MLATDPDREGEAIAWHIADEITQPEQPIARVEFHEITKRGVSHGVANPRALDSDLYDAQRARRVLDRIVGYDVSALVWAKLAFGLSAGRVQSVALRLIVDREREVERFVPEEYWNIGAGLTNPAGAPFYSKLASRDGKKLEVKNGTDAGVVRDHLDRANYRIAKMTRREQKRNPPAPYTTSKLQQDATSYLHFATKRTMQVAQGLYEGVDLKRDGGPVGLITYIRTDSTRVSQDAIAEVREHVEKRYGKAFVPEKPNTFRSKKNTQDAHEAIRPTSMDLPPEAVRKHLKDEQYKLYKLIWNRFVASQMTPAVYDRTTADVEAVAQDGATNVTYGLRATGRIQKFAGWLQVTEGQQSFAGEGEAEGAEGSAAEAPVADAPVQEVAEAGEAAAEEENEALLPDLNEGERCALRTPPGVVTDQKFTQPPARYNEGSLVRELEKRGIGRPSTYAEIIAKVQARAYVEKLPGGAFKPSELGKYVVDGLVKSNLDFMDPGFTAQMEEELDEVGNGKVKRIELLGRFYKRFREQLDLSKKLKSWKPEVEKTDIVCTECGSMMVKKWGKNGWFLSCEKYPKCKSTRDLGTNGPAAPVRETSFLCDKCGKPMVIKSGRFGDFLSCTGYPTCKNARPIPLGVACPVCGGDIIEIRSRRKGGKTFYGCSNYSAEQKCEFKLWQKPVNEPCPKCEAKFLTYSGGKKPMLICATKDCGYKREAPLPEGAEPAEGAALEGADLAGADVAEEAKAADESETPTPSRRGKAKVSDADGATKAAPVKRRAAKDRDAEP